MEVLRILCPNRLIQACPVEAAGREREPGKDGDSPRSQEKNRNSQSAWCPKQNKPAKTLFSPLVGSCSEIRLRYHQTWTTEAEPTFPQDSEVFPVNWRNWRGTLFESLSLEEEWVLRPCNSVPQWSTKKGCFTSFFLSSRWRIGSGSHWHH